MAIKQPLGTVIPDPKIITTEIGLALANGGVYAIQTTQDVYVTQVVENTYRQTVNTTINNPGGKTTGEVQFFDGRGFAADSDFKYDAATDTLKLRGNLDIVGNINLAGALNSSGRLNLGAPSSFTISGGTPGSVLSTDGFGGMSWVSVNGATYSNANVAAFLPTYFGNVNGGNGSFGNLVSAQYYSGTLVTGYQPNITTVGTLSTLSVTGAVTTGPISVAGTIISSGNIQGSNISTAGNITGLNLDINNITASGNLTLSQSILASNVTATHFGDGGNLTNISGANIVGEVANATHALTADVAYEIDGANVVGAVTSALTVPGSGVAGNVSAALVAYSVDGANVVGIVADANYAAYAGNVTLAGQSNITSVGTLTALTVAGVTNLGPVGNLTIAGGTTGQVLTTDGSGVLSWATAAGGTDSNLANFAGNVTVAAQPNITSVGTLTGLAVNGTTSLGLVGNVSIAGGSTGQVLTTDGTGVLSWTTISATEASNGTSSTQVNVSNVTTVIGGTTIQTVDANGVTITGNANVSGNVNASYFIGNGSQLTDIAGANIVGDVTSAITANFANYAGNVTVAAQPNITSVGTLISLAVTGNIDGANLTGAHYGDGSNLSGITGANVVGDVTSAITANFANYAGNVTVADQPNITSVGTLTGITSTGVANFIDASNVTLGPVANVHITGGTIGQVLSTDGSGTLNWVTVAAGSGDVSGPTSSTDNAVVRYDATTGKIIQDSVVIIDDTGAVTGVTDLTTTGALTVGGVSTLGPVGNVSITGGTTGQVLTTDGAGTLSWQSAATATYGDANVAIYLPTHTGNVGAGNIVLTGTTSRIDAAGTVAILPSAGNTVDLGNTRLLFDITPVNAQGGNVGTTALPFFEGHFVNVFGDTFTGEAGNLSNIQGANVVGNVTSAITANFANFAGNVTEAAQPNITSVGTLTALAVSGTTNLGAVGNVTITGGTTGQVLSTDGSGVLSWTTAGGASYYDMKTNVIAHEVQYRDYDTGLGGSAPTTTVTTRADASALKPGDILQLLVYNGIANKPTGTLVEYVWTRDTVTGVYLWSRNVTLNSDNTISIQSYKTPMFDRSGQTSISFMYATQSYTVSTATVFTASNLPVSGSVASTTLVLTISNNSTITWPTGTRWPSGTPPTLGNGTHVVSMMTYDGGTTFLAAALTSYA